MGLGMAGEGSGAEHIASHLGSSQVIPSRWPFIARTMSSRTMRAGDKCDAEETWPSELRRYINRFFKHFP